MSTLGMRPLMLCAVMFLVCHYMALACDAEPSIAVSWRLVENLPENRFRAELRLRNQSDEALAANWELFFNSAARVLPESVAPEFELEHRNGDLFVLRPGKQYRAIEPDESIVVAMEGSPWAINRSDAPSGFYFVTVDANGQPATPVSIARHIEVFPASEKLRRGASDVVPVVTAQSRFDSNERLALLPIESLAQVTPMPIATRSLSGKVILDASTTIQRDDGVINEGEFLADCLVDVFASRPAISRLSSHEVNAIRLRIGEVQINDERRTAGEEAYELTINLESGIEIVGTDPAGVFYGIQTLRALLPLSAYRAPAQTLELSGVQIKDAPRFRYRGLHLDVARNFQSKATVKKLIDLMAFYKLNRLHWHLTDDEGWRIEIKALPELTSVGSRRTHTLDERNHLQPSLGSGPEITATGSGGSGFYTQDDIVEILRHAHQRHIQVIPELDFPGHARAAVKAMQARHDRLAAQGDHQDAAEFLLTDPADKSQYESVQMWNDNVVDPGLESTYQFLHVVVGELAGLYREAGVELTELHLGGDEVPAGAWQNSPACAAIETVENDKLSRNAQLQLHFLRRASAILDEFGVRPACWEDCVLKALASDESALIPNGLTVFVWNNVWGWGGEDAAYKIANAGHDVVLCNATHLYFDLAYEKDPHEIGYYWAGFVDARAPFELIPLDVFKNARNDGMGRPLSDESLRERARLTPEGRSHVLGIQGQLWSENLRSADDLEYMAFPKLIALAERAWAADPAWAKMEVTSERERKMADDWNQFANRLGQRELPRLDYLHGGVSYRLPSPGAVTRDGMVHANVEYPGLLICYTLDGTEPGPNAALYRQPIPADEQIRLRVFDSRERGGRTIEAKSNSSASTNLNALTN